MYRTFLLYQSRSALVHLFKWHSLHFGVLFFFITFFFSILCCHYLLSLVFLGGLSSHLNHLIVSRMTNYKWPFGTFSFGLFWSNLDKRDFETYPRTYNGHFWNMSIFDDSRAVWILFRKWVVSQIKVFLMKEQSLPPYQFSFRRRGP